MAITLKYPGVTVLEMALSCPGSVRTRPCTVKGRTGIPCKSSGTFVAMAAASTSGKDRSRQQARSKIRARTPRWDSVRLSHKRPAKRPRAGISGFGAPSETSARRVPPRSGRPSQVRLPPPLALCAHGCGAACWN
jgi:hypothetical protein